MKLTKSIASFYIGLALMGCDNNTTSTHDDATTTSSNKKFKTVTALRYIIENHKKLTDKDIAKYLKSLNDTDKSTLKTFDAFGSYLQYRACRVDNTILMDGVTTGVQNCQQNLYRWLNSLYAESPYFPNYTFEQWYYTTQPDINKLSQSEQDKLFSYAYSSIQSFLIGMKCDSDEIDKKSCQTYFHGQAQYQDNIKSLNDSRVHSYGEVTQQLYRCTYEGQIMEDGSICTR